MRRLLVTVLVLVLQALAVGCGDGGSGSAGRETAPARAASSAASPSAPQASSSAPSTTPSSATTSTAAPPATRQPAQRWVRGVDASHHQGAIDWTRVAGGGYRFAYLKASEGTSFTDPRFASNRSAAIAAGLQVGGYHYFSLCTPGAAQAEHFVRVLGDLSGRDHLPPAIDLEIAGSCADRPDRASLLGEVRTFLDLVERRTGRQPIVYLYPEFESAYDFAGDLSHHRQWVRALGDRPPTRAWWIWQRSATATVPGINGPADVNVMRGGRRS